MWQLLCARYNYFVHTLADFKYHIVTSLCHIFIVTPSLVYVNLLVCHSHIVSDGLCHFSSVSHRHWSMLFFYCHIVTGGLCHSSSVTLTLCHGLCHSSSVTSSLTVYVILLVSYRHWGFMSSILAECNKGFYKDTLTPDKCTACPENSTTRGTGSTSLSDCKLLPGILDV